MNLNNPKGAAALEIVRKLKTAGYDALFAGGCVRDHLLGTQPTDYDIATSATPDQVESLFLKTIPVGKQFGVILVMVGDLQFEVATFRTEGGYQDGRRPGFVNFSNAQDDASRRDFMVNGLFYDPLAQKVLDYVDGQEDITKKVIRCIGDPTKRFEEDKLRLLRAIRFAVRLRFRIEEKTWTELKKRAPEITVVSRERIQDELSKILISANPALGIELLTDSGLLQVLLPQVNGKDTQGRLRGRTFKCVAPAYATLFLGVSRKDVLLLLKDLRCSNDIISGVSHIFDILEAIGNFGALTLGNQEKLLNDQQYIDALNVFTSDPINSSKFGEFRKKWEQRRNKTLPIAFLTGADLKDQGVQQGPKLGKILEEAYLQQLEGKFQDKTQALSWAKTQI